ncbi:MAG TPA: aminotransferase class III-fold pyridoxal phosphate-dependent enzyme [Dehalococcoidia bacterium]|nr:aminotransferase class III-fold pyridoxal phosphate-dependent enzyme [Dehalococcoidia bacterium]
MNGCIERASGTRIWDESGKEYIDFLLASGPLILGHSHPRVTKAVAEQLQRGSAYYSVNRPAVDLAEMLVEVPGSVDIVRFASTGTEATMHAVRLARAYTTRDKVLVFAGGYHGSHDVSIVGHGGALKAQRGGVPRSLVDDVLVASFDDVDSVRNAFAQHGKEIAAVLIEPQQRSQDPRPGFLEELRELTVEAGAVLIFDEVLTGFRLAYGGAQEYFGVEPDLVCYGKIVGGGFPLAAVGGRSEIMAHADPARASSSDYVHFSGTLSGNPISATAGVVTLRELQAPGVYPRLHALGGHLRSSLREAMDYAGVAGRVYGSGPLAAVTLNDVDGPDSGKLLKSEVNREMIARGILVQLQTRFYVSLAHTEPELDQAAEAFADSLIATRRSLAI